MIKFTKLHIFVEGPDGVGKSTIAKLLAKKLNIPVLKMVKAKKAFKLGSIEELSRVFNQVLLQLEDINYIVERGPFTSLIYSGFYKRKDNLDYIVPLIRQLKPLVIYLTVADSKLLITRKKNDQIISRDDRIRLLLEYDNFFNKTSLAEVLTIDTSNKTPKQIIERILLYLEQQGYTNQG